MQQFTKPRNYLLGGSSVGSSSPFLRTLILLFFSINKTPEILKLFREDAPSCRTPCVEMLLRPDIFIEKTAALKQRLQNVMFPYRC